jgi:hypothetical protein
MRSRGIARRLDDGGVPQNSWVQIFQRPTGGLIAILIACLLQSNQMIQELFNSTALRLVASLSK